MLRGRLWGGGGQEGEGYRRKGLNRTFDFDGDDAAVGGSVLYGVMSVAVDTGLAVETRSSSSSPVPFPPEDLTQMSERRWVSWGVRGWGAGCVSEEQPPCSRHAGGWEGAGRGGPGDSR